jgi:drug/metabolite transporter (DMT)-like permease
MYRMWFSVFLLLPILAGDRLKAVRRKSSRAGLTADVDANRAAGAAANAAISSKPPKPAPADWALCLLSGLFLAAHFWVWFESLQLTSITSSTVLVNTNPIFVLIFGYLLLKERVSTKGVVFVLVAVAGIAVLSFGDFARGVDTLAGDLLAVLSAAAVSGYMLIGRKVRRFMDALIYVVLVYFVAAVCLTVITVAGGIPVFDYSGHDYLMFLGMAFFCTLLGHTVFNWALRYLKTSFIATMVLMEPVFATLLGMAIFKEFPGWSTAIGGVVVLFGIIMFVREEGNTAG